MKNQTQIERKSRTASRAEQQRRDDRRRKLSFIEAHGSKEAIRKLTLVIDIIARVARASAVKRRAFSTFVVAAKSQPFTQAFAKLTARHPQFTKDRVALKIIAAYAS